MNRCLCCFGPLGTNDPRCKDYPAHGYHRRCAVQLFGTAHAPQLSFSLDDIEHIGVQVVRSAITIPGVQRKLSLDWQHPDHPRPNDRLTIVGLWGRYILKPPNTEYSQLPENEALLMELSRTLGIPTALSGLIPLDSGELCYLVKRFDRNRDNTKLPMEDFAQISGRLTEDKYKGSYDQVAKLMNRYSTQPGIDVVRFYELLLYCYVVGNGDMHLKNFALYAPNDWDLQLTPAFDLVSTALVIPEDKDECALTLNGKKRKLQVADWLTFAEQAGVAPRAAEKLMQRMVGSSTKIQQKIEQSLLSDGHKQTLFNVVQQRLRVLKA